MTVTFSESEPVARKDHRCHWCGEAIPKGARYWLWRGVFDHAAQTTKMHLECRRAASESSDLDTGFLPYVNERGVPDD